MTVPPFLARTRAPIRFPAQVLSAAVLVALPVPLFLAWVRTLGRILVATVIAFPDLAPAVVPPPAVAEKIGDDVHSVLLAVEDIVPWALAATNAVDSVDGRQPPTLVLVLFQQPVVSGVLLVVVVAAADNTDCDAVESILHRLVGGGVAAAAGFDL